MPLGSKMVRPGVTVYIGLYRETHEKNFLSKTTRPRALIFGMKHHLVNFYQVWSNLSLGPKMAPPPESHVLHRHIKGKHEKYVCLKSYGLEPWYLVCSITLWASTKFVQIMPLQPKKAQPRGHMFYTGLYRAKHKKPFLKPPGLVPW